VTAVLRSRYDGLQLTLTRRFSRDLQFRGAYTFSKSLDEGSSLANAILGTTNAFTMNPLQPHLDYQLVQSRCVYWRNGRPIPDSRSNYVNHHYFAADSVRT
jgi:hypothetical protein